MPALAGSRPVARALVPPRPIAVPNGLAATEDALYVAQPAIDGLVKVSLDTGAVAVLASDRDHDSEELVTPDDVWVDPAS